MARGKEIANHPEQIMRIDDFTYKVHSQSAKWDIWYTVQQTKDDWYCACIDYKYRGGICKHIYAVQISKKLRERIENARVIPTVDVQSCLFCFSKNVVKRGLRHNKNGPIQTLWCKDCGKRFTRNLGFEGLRATPKTVTAALQLYFSGESLRNTQKFLRLQGVNVSHQTVLNWITKYVNLMTKYLEQITPQVSDTWRADELWIKMKGNLKYVYAMMDDETRFWIAQEVADTKYTHDARKLFHASQELMGKRPLTLITDGAPNYQDAFSKEYYTMANPRSVHIREIAMAGRVHNNKMERMNGEIRDREKTMRGLKTEDTPILKGLQLYHNFIRPHEGLDGKTPAEMAGIRVEGEDKWMTIIQNASKEKRRE